MTYLAAAILSFLEGITEFLPISSTGHLILATNLLKIEPTDFITSFEIAIQLGAILAIVFLYRKTLTTNLAVTKRLAVSFLPTMVIGLLAYPIVKQFLLKSTTVTSLALLVGGVILIILEKIRPQKPTPNQTTIDTLSYKTAFAIGLFQSISIIPGVSRAAATIIGGLMLGLNRKAAVEYSFLLAVPTMLAATILDLSQTSAAFSSTEVLLLLFGSSLACMTAVVTVKFLLRYINRHNFIPFGIYRILLGLAFLAR